MGKLRKAMRVWRRLPRSVKRRITRKIRRRGGR